jgi:hypothetical protein
MINQIKFPNGTKQGIRAQAIPAGTVNNTSTATAFTATISGITELKDGVCCYLRNNKITSAANCTLNINNLGAKPIYSSTASAKRITTEFEINHTVLFVYNSSRVSGGCWDMIDSPVIEILDLT